MATDDKPAEDDGLADWAEALMEQKSTDTAASPESGGVLSEDLPRNHSSSSGYNSDAPIKAQPTQIEDLGWEHIQRVLHEHDGNISATARALNMHRRTLQRKLAKPPSRSE